MEKFGRMRTILETSFFGLRKISLFSVLSLGNDADDWL